jgi:hypothetical protein
MTAGTAINRIHGIIIELKFESGKSVSAVISLS